MELNASKCKTMRVGRRIRAPALTPENHQYVIRENEEEFPCQQVNCEKDLGVFLDPLINFHSHITKKVKKAKQISGLIFRSFKFLDKSSFVLLFKSLIRPHVEYASCVWSPATRKYKTMVERVQRQATKRVPGMLSLSYPERMRALGLPSLEYRRMRADMLQVYKIMHQYEDVNSTEFLKMAETGRTRGHAQKLEKERTRTMKARGIFRHRVVDNWNGLPERIVNAPNVNSFKSQLNTHWRDHPLKFSPP
eukprot:GHVO01040696.1.p1 GENE.GHVO01040696.1~~GHVO01040696.1.p1  ORF type:complete len:250 (+),score=12.86 GHVO01040696.1:161-910(+)